MVLKKKKQLDKLGIEPNTSRMLSERDNQLHHLPDHPNVHTNFSVTLTFDLDCQVSKPYVFMYWDLYHNFWLRPV